MVRRIQLRRDDLDLTVDVGAAEVTLVLTGDAFAVQDEGDGRFVVTGADQRAVHAVAAASGDIVWVSVEGHGFEFHVQRDAGRGRSTARDHDALTAPMPATVVRIAVKPGDAVKRGDVLIVLEAMKMELPIRAPRDMVVGAIHCREGDLVQPGVVLVE